MQHAAGLALKLPKPASLAAQEPMEGMFRELDALLGLGTDHHREHGRSLAADLTRTAEAAVQCREVAASLLAAEEGGGEGLRAGQGAEPRGARLFAELDGLLLQSDAAVERVAAPRLSPFKKEMEALLTKVSSESSALSLKHQADPPDEPGFDELGDRDCAAVSESAEADEEQAPSLEIAVESTAPIFEELDSLLRQATDQHQEDRASLEASLARAVSDMEENQEQMDSVAEQLLYGDDPEDPAHAAWRRGALESLRREAKRNALPTASSTASGKPALSFNGSKPVARRSMFAGYATTADRSMRAMSCI